MKESYKKNLTPEQYRILVGKGTEPPFSGKYVQFDKDGKYTCAACDTELFDSNAKFYSKSGWPSFHEAKNVDFKEDLSLEMKRMEVLCKNCGGHLGHVFDDGPKGKRYCINSLSLDFKELATFGAGCFWHVQKEFKKLKGVFNTTVGYMGGHTKNPRYEEVCTGKTGHIEVCQIEFKPDIISYEELLEAFWNIHDPTQLDKQGPDIGTQYKSVIFCHDKKQKQAAITSKDNKQNHFSKAIVTEIRAAGHFYRAENYHQS